MWVGGRYCQLDCCDSTFNSVICNNMDRHLNRNFEIVKPVVSEKAVKRKTEYFEITNNVFTD